MRNQKDQPRLIEVAFPLRQASLASVHEKNVRHGHISTLHIWPARRPLATCRALRYAPLPSALCAFAFAFRLKSRPLRDAPQACPVKFEDYFTGAQRSLSLALLLRFCPLSLDISKI